MTRVTGREPSTADGWRQARGSPGRSRSVSPAAVEGAGQGVVLHRRQADRPARAGGLIVARHGSGYFCYTGLSFFRQLPAGVGGAYRLFVNLVELGSREKARGAK